MERLCYRELGTQVMENTSSQAEDSEVTQRVARAGSRRPPRGWQVSGKG